MNPWDKNHKSKIINQNGQSKSQETSWTAFPNG